MQEEGRRLEALVEWRNFDEDLFLIRALEVDRFH